jgi:hypothetical protein
MMVNFTKKEPPGVAGGSCFLQVCLFLSHDPDQSNHKGSLLRKKENNNQGKDNFEQVHQVHFGIPF